MCSIIEHTKNNCNSQHLYIYNFGLACGHCDAVCTCENKRQYDEEREKIENEWKDWHESNQGVTGYSYPFWQVKSLKNKYKIK